MHELSIASSIIDTVLKECQKKSYRRVNTIALRIGALTDIVPEALTFGFDSLKDDTILANTSLSIENVPVKGSCNSCGESFEVEEFIFICPKCDAVDIKTVSGDELEIAYLEIDE